VSGLAGNIDQFEAPCRVGGWALWRADGVLKPELRIELRRGEEVLATTTPSHPREDASGDADHLAGFMLDCAVLGGPEPLLAGEATLWVVAKDGAALALPLWEVLRARIMFDLKTSHLQTATPEETARLLGVLAASPTLPENARAALHAARAALFHPLRRTRAPKITFIGAGSTVFARTLLGDILLHPALSHARICLHDTDVNRLRTSFRMAERLVTQRGDGAEVSATTRLGAALEGADYAINMIQVGGYEPATVTDFELPKRFGLRQTIGDTLGIGGIMRGLRTIPVLLSMAREMEARCPNVLHLNYTNPMAMNCAALNAGSAIRTIGLCHSVPETAALLARDLGLAPEPLDYVVAGINHMAFFLKLSADGADLYPRLKELARSGNVPEGNRVRYDALTRLGYFVTESSEHFAEYVPWYIKSSRPDLIERYGIPLDEYPRRCRAQIAGWRTLEAQMMSDEAAFAPHLSHEYGARIINAIETGAPTVVYGNVRNDGLIANLPDDACVELPCLVDGNGVQPTSIGALAPQLAALMQTNIAVQRLTVEAALTLKREHIYHAALLDPHMAAELPPDEIFALVDALIAAHGDLLPRYS